MTPAHGGGAQPLRPEEPGYEFVRHKGPTSNFVGDLMTTVCAGIVMVQTRQTRPGHTCRQGPCAAAVGHKDVLAPLPQGAVELVHEELARTQEQRQGGSRVLALEGTGAGAAGGGGVVEAEDEGACDGGTVAFRRLYARLKELGKV